MTTRTTAYAWDIYAEQLYPHGYGYPLWQPDHNFPCGEVEIGDVGYIEKGGFFQLFNSMRNSDDRQALNGVPAAFEQFKPSKFLIYGPKQLITQRYIYSGIIKDVDVSGSVSAGG